MFNNKSIIAIISLSLVKLIFLSLPVILISGTAHAWPTAADWIPLVNSTGFIDDPERDYNQCQLDIVGDASNPAAMIYNDGQFIYYRIRVNCDPSGPGGLQQNTWGILIDTDQNADAYEWMVRIDGRPTDEIVISQNTIQGTLGDPSDSAEVDVWSEPLDSTPGSENYKITTANTSFPSGNKGPDADYWLEFRYPYDIWLYYMGLDDNSIIRYFVGTGPSGWTLSGDLVGTSLYTDLTNPILPSGTEPTTGYVKFVADLLGNGDVTEAYPGDTLYIKVEDLDRNDQKTSIEILTVIINTPGGDSETVVLTETGLSTGIFTGSILTADNSPAISNGVLDLSPIETVRVLYVDAVDALLNKNRSRYDSLTAMPSADVGITKSVNKATPNEGDIIAYTLTLHNYGASDASGLQIRDLLPSGLIYNSDNGAGLYNPTTGIWTVSSLIDGQSRTLIINAVVDTGTAGQLITNDSNINYNPQLDPNPSNDAASASVTVQGAELELVKVVNSLTPNEGASIIYTLTLTNNGTNDATGIIVNDVLPSGVTYSGHSGAGSYNPATGVWDGLSIINGASATLDIAATVDAGTSGNIITNFAIIVSADQADPVSTNNSSSASLAVAGVDLVLSKTVDDSTPNVGQTLTFTVTLINNSTNTATGIQVSDLLPAGLSYSFDSPSIGSYNPATGIWSGFSLSPGASAALDISASVDSGTGGTVIVNQAQVTAVDQTDLDTSNNSDSASVTVMAADLSITKVVDNPSPDVNELVTFTVTLTNNGPDTATGIEVTDTMSSSLTPLSNTPEVGSYDAATDVWSVPSLAPGVSNTLVIIVNAPSVSGVAGTNTATITASDLEDVNASNDTASVTVTAGGIDLMVVKTVDNVSPSVNTDIIYTVTVYNIGDFPATGITIIDSLPSGISYKSETKTQGSYNQSSGLWQTLTIANGASATLTITASVDSTSNGMTIENTARVSASDQTDINITNNLDKATIYVGSTDMSVSKAVDDQTPTEGDLVSFTVTVTNNGLNNAVGVEVTDLLPAGLVYNSDDGGGSYNFVNGIWNATTNPSDPFILPGGSRTLIINATVDSGTYGQTIINYAEITSTGQLDPDNTNDLAGASLTVQASDISVLKTADDATPDEGDVVSFTITATNHGPHDATGIALKDLLPSGLTYTSDNGGGAYDPVTGIWNAGDIGKLSTATLIVNATVDMGTGGSTITNIANIVSAEQVDPVGMNNSSSFEVSPVAVPWPQISMSKSVITYYDTINLNSGNQKALPGAYMLYTITIENDASATGSAILNTVDDVLSGNVTLIDFMDIGLGTGSPSSSTLNQFLVDCTTTSGDRDCDSLTQDFNGDAGDFDSDGASYSAPNIALDMTKVLPDNTGTGGTHEAGEIEPGDTITIRYMVEIK